MMLGNPLALSKNKRKQKRIEVHLHHAWGCVPERGGQQFQSLALTAQVHLDDNLRCTRENSVSKGGRDCFKSRKVELTGQWHGKCKIPLQISRRDLFEEVTIRWGPAEEQPCLVDCVRDCWLSIGPCKVQKEKDRHVCSHECGGWYACPAMKERGMWCCHWLRLGRVHKSELALQLYLEDRGKWF